MTKPRLGHINFLNVLPLTYSFQNSNTAEGINLSCGVPAIINNDLMNGRLDVSEVSSIVYAKNHEKLIMLPDLCVRADGEVQSIMLVSRKPIHEINEDKIVMTAKSATSHCMLKIILRNAYDARPDYYIRHISPEDPIPDDAQAALLIGDDALYVFHHRKKYDYYYYDLGREWKKMTGRCMVYAVWVANREYAQKNPEAIRAIYQALYNGIKDGYSKKNDAIQYYLKYHNNAFTAEQISVYLERIKWNLTDEHADNLKTFYSLAHDLNLIDSRPKMDFADVY